MINGEKKRNSSTQDGNSHTLMARALDEKHVSIRKPSKGESVYFSFKGRHFVSIMALFGTVNKFVLVNKVGTGSCADAHIWNDCNR